MGKLKLSQISYPVVEITTVVSHVGNIWIGPWANFPHYMDPTLFRPIYLSVLEMRDLDIARYS